MPSNIRPPRLLRPLVALCLLGASVSMLGCPAEQVPADDETGTEGLLAGDLVISEIMADPEGADDGLEWFEIYNATSEPIDLEGLTLVYAKVDGSGRKAHTVARSVEVPAGGYVVVGGLLDEIAIETAHIDYGFANELGAFGNQSGYLAVEQGDSTIDEVYYQGASSGVSRAFDGSKTPDASVNDDLAQWCDGKTEFDGPTFVATPKAANDFCSQEGCLDGDQLRPVDPPALGELVITEVHANPSAVGDADGEWFEIHALADFDLNGLEIGKLVGDPAEETMLDPACMPVSAGEYVVVAKSEDPTVNGGVPFEVIRWITDMSFTNSSGSLWLGVGGEVLDAVTWGSVGDGKATQLDPDSLTPEANDALTNWCPATLPYGDGDLGSPGLANEECPIEAPEGQCVDPDTDELRDIDPVAQGDLVITELLANPDVVDDGAGEFIELLAIGSGDLNGLQIGKAGGWEDQLASGTCLEVIAGSYVVLAHEADPSVNGGLPQVDAVFDMALNNSGSDLMIGFEVAQGQVEVWDQVTWPTSPTGKSRSFGGDLNVLANDDEAAWCEGVGVYGDGDEGTPGAANPSCGGGGGDTCIDPDTNMPRMIIAPAMGEVTITEVMPNPNAVLDGEGEWFELLVSEKIDLNGLQIGKNGVVGFTLTAEQCVEVEAGSWLAFALSDDPLLNGGVSPVAWVYEGVSLVNTDGNLFVGFADQVLDEATWASSPVGASLSLDTMTQTWCPAVDAYGAGDKGTPALPNPACGGGGGNDCLDGGAARPIVSPVLGEIVISEFMANPAVVADASGEWIELRALANFDLNGLELGKLFVDGPLLTLDAADCLAVVAGDAILLARDSDPLVNGGLPTPDFEFGFSVNNTSSGLYIGIDGVLLDEITYASVADGASTSLDPDFYDPSLNDMAANGVTWCYSPTNYSVDNKGTPQLENEQCG